MLQNPTQPAPDVHGSLKTAVFFALSGLVVLAIALGGFGLYQIRALNQQFDRIQQVNLPKIEMAREMRGVGSARMIHILRMVMLSDPFERDAEMMRFRTEATRFIAARDTLKQLPMSAVEQRKLGTVLTQIGALSQMQNRVAELLLEGRDDEANAILLAQAIPLQDGAIRELAEFAAMSNRAMVLEGQRVNQRYLQSVVAMTIAALAALALGGTVIWRVTRKVGVEEAHIHDEIHQAEAAAEHDLLTGLLNRRGFEPRLQALMQHWQPGQCHTLLMMDLDGFKAVNDTGGHAAGDALLQGLAGQLLASVRGRDIVARLGGDEFAIILVDAPGHAAGRVAETIRANVKAFALTWNGAQYRVGVSIGAAEINAPSMQAEALLKRADAACYEAKQNGRNQVRHAA